MASITDTVLDLVPALVAVDLEAMLDLDNKALANPHYGKRRRNMNSNTMDVF